LRDIAVAEQFGNAVSKPIRIADSWYVSVRASGEPRPLYVKTHTFRTECNARQFAAARLAEGCQVIAGTLDPHQPRRAIASSQIPRWLNSQDTPPSRG
jgi:hypothetical protein